MKKLRAIAAVMFIGVLTGAAIEQGPTEEKCDIPRLLRKYAGKPIGDVEIKNGDALCLAREAFKKSGWLDEDGDFKEQPKKKR